MHAFNRGFNGKIVGMAATPHVGPVPMSMGVAPTAAPPILGPSFMPASAAPRAVAPAPRQVAPAPVKSAPVQAPGSVPMGKKADCPVCRTFGG